MTNIYVQVENRGCDEYHSSEQYGDWHRHEDNVVSSVHLSPDSGYSEMVAVEADINVGDTVYVFYIRYSSGDSFGNSTGNLEILHVFKDYDCVIAAEMTCRPAAKMDAQQFTFIADGNKPIVLSNPAYGYFENLEEMRFDEFTVES